MIGSVPSVECLPVLPNRRVDATYTLLGVTQDHVPDAADWIAGA